MSNHNLRILGTGSFLPKNLVENNHLESKLGLDKGWIEENCGVLTRYHIQEEEASELGAQAALIALKSASLIPEEIDLIIGVSGVMQQAIPTMSALIHKKLGLKKTQTFDVNSTCLSFVTGLSLASNLIESGKYKNILLVSADVASVGLDPNNPKTATLFGDGAAAVIVGPSLNSSSRIKSSSFETWTETQDACKFEACGTKLHLKELSVENGHKQYFQMNGPKLFKAAIPHAMKLIEKVLEDSNMKMEDIDVCIPHQASPFALRLFHNQLLKKYESFSAHFLNIVHMFGNMIATSIPHALDFAIRNNQLKRGQNCLIVGTSAGLSVGGLILEY
ncbi:MAG: 3-oxoacyl-[acyl-carrier-protein] synthase III C-terminal domain-containing protein [Rhabdochlamydiaceae bacterium]|nr:3-oxoacyl-[acyl-carrier-protein] synthase III C-terminal domain-containing protein [Candidatus Amphrikana amoebophyrae]